MQAIEFYFDPISPFAYLGSVQIERVAARLGREVDWKPVLIGVTILKVMGLKPVPETPLKGPYLQQDAVRLAEYFDVPFRYHGLKGINALAALRAFLMLKRARRGAGKILRAEDIRPAVGAWAEYHRRPKPLPRRRARSASTRRRFCGTSRRTTPRAR